MPTDNNAEIIKKLLAIKTTSEVEDFIKNLDVADSRKAPQKEEYIWKLVGGDLSNASHINLAKSSVSPIVERVINAFDATIEQREFEEFGGEAAFNLLPKSPRDAVSKWFKIPGGDLATFSTKINNTEKNKYCEDVQLIFEDSGDPKQPTLIIRDNGIGQHPNDFAKTLVQLGSSNKMGDPHLHGNYGHGGASTYNYCTYTIIISRRAKCALNGKTDEIGWTIIRKNRDYEVWNDKTNIVQNVKLPPVYQYLALRSGDVPKILSNQAEFEQGTYVAHIEYDARQWQNISFEGWRALRSYLFDPVLPFQLIDNRPKADEKTRNMFGARSTLIVSKDVVYKSGEVVEELEDGGKLKVRYWLLCDLEKRERHPLENYLERSNSKNTIILTLNGQQHSTMNKNIVSHKAKLPRVSDVLLIQVVTDDLTREMKGEIFTAAREGHSTTKIELIEQKLIEILYDDQELREWEKKLGELKSGDEQDVLSVKKILDQLLDIGSAAGIGGSSKTKSPGGVGNEIPYVHLDPPTIFDFLSKKESIEITQGASKTVTLALNGPNNLFTRKINRGRVDIKCPDGVTAAVNKDLFYNGRLSLTINVATDAPIGDKQHLKLTFSCANLKTPKPVQKSLIIIAAPIYNPVEPPSEFKILRSNLISVHPGERKLIQIGVNCHDDILDRETNQAKLNVIIKSPLAHFIRRMGPKKGKIQLTVEVDKTVKIDDEIPFTCELCLADGTVFSDTRTLKVTKKETRTPGPKGDYIDSTLPNYDIKRVYKNDWPSLSWNEADVGKFIVTVDDENKDKLIFYVNMDHLNLEDELNKRISSGTSPVTLDLLKDKYTAYVCYHLYQQFEQEKPEYVTEDATNNTTKPDVETETNRSLTDEQKAIEMKRVGKTIIFALSKIRSADDFA